MLTICTVIKKGIYLYQQKIRYGKVFNSYSSNICVPILCDVLANKKVWGYILLIIKKNLVKKVLRICKLK